MPYTLKQPNSRPYSGNAEICAIAESEPAAARVETAQRLALLKME
jgi:hypothetical protein